jgi:hypothetical protein
MRLAGAFVTAEERALRRSLNLLEQIQRRKSEIAAEASRTKTEQTTAALSAGAAPVSGATAYSAPPKASSSMTVQFLPATGGQPINAAFQSESDAMRLLAMLKQAGLRTTH